VSVGEALPQEINRVRALQDEYKAMRGMPGVMVEPAIALMETSIQNAIRVSAEGDVIKILRAYEDLKGYE
jgi:hypothetical protein